MARTTGAAAASRCAIMTSDGSTATTARSRFVRPRARPDVNQRGGFSDGLTYHLGDSRIGASHRRIADSDVVIGLVRHRNMVSDIRVSLG